MAEPSKVTEEFTVHELARVRAVVQAAAAAAGCHDRSADLVLAVSELATNAIRHGGGRGRLTIDHVDGGVVVEVRDWGPGLDQEPSGDPPAPMARGGRGLWLARKLFPDLALTNGPNGLIARLSLVRR